MLTVEKIGGTSMSKFGECLKNIIIGNRKGDELYNRILVVSAYDNVTNCLLEHKKTGEPGVYVKFLHGEDYEAALDDLCRRLQAINAGFADIALSVHEADQFIAGRIAQVKVSLSAMCSRLVSGCGDRNEIYLAARELLASVGESHSAWNSVNMLNNHGINATLVDLCGINDNEALTIDARIHKAFTGIDFPTTLCVATGYTKGTEGIMQKFDRGYSEVTFSKIAVRVKAGEAIIHKEFHLSSADPKIVGVEKSMPVGNTNFLVADQLAEVGMEAIHPKAAKPLELAGVRFRIKNTFQPEHPGTLISREYVSPEPKVEIVSGTEKGIALEVRDPQLGNELDCIMRAHEVGCILKAEDENGITMVVNEKPQELKMLEELRRGDYDLTVKRVAVVCAMGTNVACPVILGRAEQALSEEHIDVKCVGQTNMQFVIPRDRYAVAVRALNDALCLQKCN
jgi:aspartate kinase